MFRLYVFHIISPETQIWKKILSQTNILNIFPSSVPYNTVAKILQNNCRHATKKYIPALLMWLNRVFTDLANTDKRYCLTIDCSEVNKNSPGRYRAQADDVEKQQIQISYRRYKQKNVEKVNFVLDVFSFLTQNLNPTGLDRKLETALERDYVKMIWDTCLLHTFSKFIYSKENFVDPCQPHITYQKASNIVLKFVEEDPQNFELLKAALREHLHTIQYLYLLLFPKIYNRTIKFGINDKFLLLAGDITKMLF